MSSPFITQITSVAFLALKGKGSCWRLLAKAVRTHAPLHFELVTALAGVESITVVPVAWLPRFFSSHKSQGSKKHVRITRRDSSPEIA